jgi:hypothetical protein
MKKQVIIVVTIVAVIAILLINNKNESFENLQYIGGSGFGFEQPSSISPLFVNFTSPNLAQDFNLTSTIRKLSMNNGIFPPGFGKSSSVQFPSKSAKCPIIIVPDIGASKIFAKWNIMEPDSIKKLDAYGNFEQNSETWKCRSYQDSWTPIWFPDQTSNLTQMCWKNNVQVNAIGDNVVNAPGVTTTVSNDLNFETGIYGPLIKSLQAVGYVANNNLFGLSYDFRTIFCEKEITTFMTTFGNLIENYTRNGKKAIIIGHGLGSVLINAILLRLDKRWKDNYIQAFITVSGSFGGCPKALRTLLNGDDIPNDSGKVVRDACINFSGLHILLPQPEIYGQTPLLLNKQTAYSSEDLSSILQETGADKVYNIVRKINTLDFPDVLVYSLCGTGLPTESNYVMSPSSDFVKNGPYYNTYGPNYENFTYSSNFNGDGTIPMVSLQHPERWRGSQSEPINTKYYQNAEHSKILSMNEPISDILGVINSFNDENKYH